MCGISGIWSKISVRREEVESMTQALAHRGPDAQEVYITPDQTIALGHRRLSVIDLSNSANQPMHSSDGRYVIVFNGEIYNFISLRNKLTKEGYKFRTSSDTEVLLGAFEKWGREVFQYLEGMFAFAILDTKDRKIFLARDRMGKKPLYYHLSDELFLFASEIKAIRANPQCQLEVNIQTLYDFLRLGYIPASGTPWCNMHKLPPGSWAEVSSPSEIQIQKYWDVTDSVDLKRVGSDQDVLNRFHQLLSDAVAKRLRSDVPLGALLSGGTDSSLVCAIANDQLNGKLKTFNIGFDDKQYDESNYANRVAKILKTDHHTFQLSSEEAIQYMDEYLIHFDEPFADTSAIPTLLVSKKTREQVTVALTGDGGDELFLGYGSHQWAERMKTWVRFGKPLANILKRMPGSWAKAGEMFDVSTFDSYQQHIFSVEQGFFSLEEVQKMIRTPYVAYTYTSPNMIGKSEAEKQAFFDLTHYLPDDLLVKVDRASMRYSLECRCPLLDHKLVEFAIGLPATFKMRGNVQKYLLKKDLEKYLPQELIYRKKWGFSVPLEKWLRTKLSYLIDEYLSEYCINKYGLLKAQEVSTLVKRFKEGESKLYHRIWALIVMHFWLQHHAK